MFVCVLGHGDGSTDLTGNEGCSFVRQPDVRGHDLWGGGSFTSSRFSCYSEDACYLVSSHVMWSCDVVAVTHCVDMVWSCDVVM